MKLHKFYGRKSLIASVSAGTLLVSNQASAQIINWAPVNAVPLSTTSTIILGLLLLAFGMFVAPRIKNGHKVTFVITAVLVGMLTTNFGEKLIKKAQAGIASETLDITTPNGPVGGSHLVQNAITRVTNDPNNVEIVITVYDPEECIFEPVENQCGLNQHLAPGASCNTYPMCVEYPEYEVGTTSPN